MNGSEIHLHQEIFLRQAFQKENQTVYNKIKKKLYHSLWTRLSPQMRLQYQRNKSYLSEVSWDVCDILFVQNKVYC